MAFAVILEREMVARQKFLIYSNCTLHQIPCKHIFGHVDRSESSVHHHTASDLWCCAVCLFIGLLALKSAILADS